MTRPCDSAYDRSFAAATERLIRDFRADGYRVETPVTGSVIVNGREFPPDEWERIAIEYDGDLQALVEDLGL